MSILDIKAFHGTDESAARKIVEGTFLVRGSEDYWLGNGAYFFLDKSLAEWWTRRPSRSFGSAVRAPAIVNCDVNIDEDNILDLRKLTDYKTFAQIYRDEFSAQYREKIYGSQIISAKKLRCLYCDFLKHYFDLKAIISNFSPSSQPYLSDDFGIYFKDFDIVYTETQCVFSIKALLKRKPLIFLQQCERCDSMLKKRNISRKEAFVKACKENGIRINVNGHSTKPFIVKRDDGNFVVATDKKVIAVTKSLKELKALSDARQKIIGNMSVRKAAASESAPMVKNVQRKEYF